MAGYIFPIAIFITSLFLCWLIIKPLERLTGFVCLILSGIATYVISLIANVAPQNAISILSISFILELILMIAVAVTHKRNLDIKAFSIFYIVIIVIALLIGKSCYNADIKRARRQDNAEKLINSYKSHYNFDIDSLIQKINHPDYSVKTKIKLKPPFIIYTKWDNKVDFDYEFNKSLQRSLTSFSLDSINTIVLIENSLIDVGTYSNGRTKAQKIETTISFIDRKTMNIVSSETLIGSEPPTSITYRRKSPESQSGSGVSQQEILETILHKLNN